MRRLTIGGPSHIGFGNQCPKDVSPGKTNTSEKPQADLALYLAEIVEKHPDLAEIVQVWPELPEHIKAAVKALVDSANYRE